MTLDEFNEKFESLDWQKDVSSNNSHDGASAVELVVAAADKGYEAERLLGAPGAVEEVMPVLREWLDPHHRGGADSREDYVMDALAVAYFLGCPRIRELAPSLMYWAYVIRYRMRVLQLLGHLDHSEIRRVVVPYVRNELTTSSSLEWVDYRDAADILYYFGFYDEVRWVIDQALAHEDPEIRQEGREIEEDFSAALEAEGG